MTDVPTKGCLVRWDRYQGLDRDPPIWGRVAEPDTFVIIANDGGYDHPEVGDEATFTTATKFGLHVLEGAVRTIYPIGEEPDAWWVRQATRALLGETNE